MSQPYRLNEPGGIKIEATGQIIYPGDPEWSAYLDWWAAQPGPDTPGGPLPPGTGLLPYEPPVLSLAELRAEALAQLDAAVALRRNAATITAAGSSWRLTWPFILAVLVHRAASTLPPGFALADANRDQVPLSGADLGALVDGISAYMVAVNQRYAELVDAINASASPLTLDLDAGWP